MKATRLDVARLAGVSTATVSNVLNASGKVKGATLERVRRAMERLNYRPNMVARSLSTRRTMQIGIVLEDLQNPFYGSVVKHFELAANRAGYFVAICTSSEYLDHYFDNFVARGLDGVFVAALPYLFDVGKFDELLRNEIHLVVSGNTELSLPGVASIENDYDQAMREAIQYLHGLGHRDIAYLTGLGQEMHFDRRCFSYLKYMQEAALPIHILAGKPPYHVDVQAGYQQARRLLKEGRAFSAVICNNDLMAIGAIRAFHEHGLSVPGDVSVMGFDGIELGRYLHPALTTMVVDAKAFGSKAFNLLYNSMTAGIEEAYSSHLSLREGESTGPLAKTSEL